jgi:hypothetical protein
MSDAVQQQSAKQVKAAAKQSIKVAKRVKKTVAKATKLKVEAKHPKFREMILEAINKLAERTGSSRQAILKYIVASFRIEAKLANQHTKIALKQGVKQGWLKQIKGVGASGSFCVGDAVKAVMSKAVKKVAASKNIKPKKKVKITKPAVPKLVAASIAKVAAPAIAAPKKVVKKAAPAAKSATPTKAAQKATPVKKTAPAKKAAPAKLRKMVSAPRCPSKFRKMVSARRS